MAAVRLYAGFPAGTKVELVRRLALELHVAGDVVASGTVGGDSTLEIDGLEPGGYWACAEDVSPIAVTAKGDRAPARAAPEPVQPPALASAAAGKTVDTQKVTGARTSANARPVTKARPARRAKK